MVDSAQDEASMAAPLRIALTGVGNRALPRDRARSNWRGWVDQIEQSSHFELVAAHDVAPVSLERLVAQGHVAKARTYLQLDAMLDAVECDALLVCSPAAFHADAIRAALDRGLHLLIEKPFVHDLAVGRDLLARIEKCGSVAAVVQNWRYKDVGRILHEHIRKGMLGRIGHVFFRYLRDREDPGLPSYIFAEPYPLLHAMGIHHLDLFRYLLGDDYAWVSGQAFKPPWSRYESTTGLHLFLETRRGVAISYSGTFSARTRAFPQESLIVEGDEGTLVCESTWLEPPLWFYRRGATDRVDLTADVAERSVSQQYDRADAFILEDFHAAIAQRRSPACSAHDAFQSLAALEACRIACDRREVVSLSSILPPP